MRIIDSWRGGGSGIGAYIFRTASASQVPLIVQGTTSQTANILEAKNVAGTVLFSIDNNGDIFKLGDETIADSLTVTGNIVGGSDLTISGDTVLSSLVAGDTTLDSLVVNGATEFVGDVVANHNLTVNNSLIANNYVYFNNKIFVDTIIGASEYVCIGDAGTTSHSLDANDDLLVSGKLEVDGLSYFDNILTITGTTNDASTNILVGNDSDDTTVFKVDTDGNISIAGNYNTSFPIDLGDDAGFQTLFDKDLTSASAADFEESVMMAIDHENFITLYAENDGSGNLQNESIKTSKRFQYKQGTAIASGTNIVIPNDGNVFELTGTTKVDLISNLGFQEGAEIDLVANESVTIDNGTATSGTNITIRLAGAGDFSMTADDMLTLKLVSTTASGQMWLEKSRSIN